MSVNSNLFNKIELFNQSIWKKERVSIASHMNESSWMCSPVKPPEKSSPSCLLIAIAREAPGKMHTTKPSHSTELGDIIINYFKILNLGLFVKKQEMNWNSDRCVTPSPEHQTCHISERFLPWGLHKTRYVWFLEWRPMSQRTSNPSQVTYLVTRPSLLCLHRFISNTLPPKSSK